MKIGIVTALFNEEVTSRLEQGARQALSEMGISTSQIVSFQVPGAFEIPLAAKKLIKEHHVDGVIALGAVIKGDTRHFDYVCQAATDGCLRVSLECEKPVGFGILTTETFEQAWARCILDKSNKGHETAMSLMHMVKKLL